MHIGKVLRIFFPFMFLLILASLVGNVVSIVGAIEVDRRTDEKVSLLTSKFQKLDMGHLEGLFAQFVAVRSDENRSALSLAENAVLSGFSNLTYNNFSFLGDQAGIIQAQIKRLRSNIERLSPIVGAEGFVGDPEDVLKILQVQRHQLQSAEFSVRRAIAELSNDNATSLRQHYTVQVTLILFLVALAAIWITTLFKQNNELERARQTESKRADLLIDRLNHDADTGVINRSVLLQRMQETHRSLSSDQKLSVVCIRLANQSADKDLKIQPVDPQALMAAADLLRHATDLHINSGCVARASGNRFLLMIVTDNGVGLTPKEFVQTLLSLFKRPVVTQNGSCTLVPAIGLSEAAETERNHTQTIENAELAAENANLQETRNYVEYHPSMRADADRRAAVERALPYAINANDCLPHFQPQFDLKTGCVTGVEALARWYHPDLGWISPTEFIPIAENTGQIVQLGWKMLETSCAEVQLLPGELSLAVNLSVIQIFNDDVVAMVKECLDRTGLPAHRLKLEVTETVVMQDLKRIQTALSNLQKLGVRISLDDFGLGYSALTYLTDIHWDEIKIDGTFAAKAVRDNKQTDILKMVLEVARTLGSDVLVEGIETVDQCDTLVQLGCTNGQGYLFGGPMAIDDVKALFFPKRTANG
ncbi:MAG: GGDEF domain-containing phosphodiesterase [Roseibium sp.]